MRAMRPMRSSQRGFWEYLIGAAASLLGSYLSNKGSASSAEQANATNVQLNEENRQWMTDLSNTSYQRAVKDMQAAGLNPMLAYSQGGANVPSSAAPQVAPVPKLSQGVGQGISAASSSALQASQVASTLQQASQSRAQTDLLSAQADKTRSETMEQSVNNAKLLAEIRKLQSSKEVDVNTADNIREGIMGTIYDSASARRRFEEMDKGGFEADVRKRKAEATLAELGIPRSKIDTILRELEVPNLQAETTLKQLAIEPARSESLYHERGTGRASPYLRELENMLRSVSSAKRAVR